MIAGVSPSPSQCRAIEAEPKSLLVLAGPGAGKTFCLTERIRFLIERHGFDPARICAFTFTNRAAGEIAHRLETRLGAAAERVKRGTIHAFCAELLRELGTRVGLEPGFGIADEAYQRDVLRRIEGPRRWHGSTLNRFSTYRFRGDALFHEDLGLFGQYEQFLVARNLVDFDMLVLKAAELLERPDDGPLVRARWDVVLVDEFQDLNPVQYRVVKALARDHRHVFAVGDDEQSIYSWAGADPSVFVTFVNDFGITAREKIHLDENRRCPKDVYALARTLVNVNTPIFADREAARADRPSQFRTRVVGFETDDEEAAWIIDDMRRDRDQHGLRWGDIAVLYRKHDIGSRLETAFLNAGVPCRLAPGRALSDDPVVAYVIAAARAIALPRDDIIRDEFFKVVLPRTLFDEAMTQAEANKKDLRWQLNQMAIRLPRADTNGRHVRRALADWRNLEAVSKQHVTLASLLQDLLSRRVGRLRSALDERHDEITDPAALPDVVGLASRLRVARTRGAAIWIPGQGGVGIALKGLLSGVGFHVIRSDEEPVVEAERVTPDDVPSVGLALGVFKAAQIIEMGDVSAAFTDFTAIDLETTDNNVAKADIVEVAAVRVRAGRAVDRFASLVKPRHAIATKAAETHGISDADVADAPTFNDVWPRFREFCGDDVVVAHNGYDFDFRILQRMVRELGGGARFGLCTFDTLPLARDLSPTSRKLVDLARQFSIPTGRSHRALDDALTLSKVLLELDRLKMSRARKTAAINLLDHLGVALALCDADSLSPEALLFRTMCRPFALGRYSNCLEAYEREQAGDLSVPNVEEVIERLGGAELMVKLRTVKTADQRYPATMARLRRLLTDIPDGSLDQQLSLFLERAVLSKWDGHEPEHARVNLLTLHSTKGLEFSRVYVAGVEDAQLPGGSPTAGPKKQEIEEARRLLYVGMTRTQDRLVLTRAASRGGKPTGGHQFLDEMGLKPEPAA